MALVLRIAWLGDFPVGFHVDEVKVGWNALSILQTLRDDHGNLLPIYYNTFGDYRPTGIFYLSIPLLSLLGNSIFAVRLTSALFGALTVIPIYLLTKALFKEKGNFGFWSAFVLAISPWHIEVSRATSEVAISTFFVIFAIYYFVKLIETNKNKYLYLSIIHTIISYTLYHSARLLIPIYFGAVLLYFFKQIDKKKILPLLFALAITLTLSINSQSRERLKQVSLFNSPNVIFELKQSQEPKVIVYSRNLIKEYGKYFSSDFLIGESAKPYRYLTLGVGLLNYIDLILLVIGTYLIFKNKSVWLIPFLLMLSPTVASLTFEDSPNLHRSFYMIPFIAILEAYAIEKFKFKKIIVSMFTISLVYFLYGYFFKSDLHIPYQKNLYIDSPTYRNIGNIELVEKISSQKSKYQQIYVTNFPDNLYPWYAFLGNLNPKDFNNKSYIENSNERRYENIIFTDTKCPSDYVKGNNILVIDSAECPTESKIKDGLKANNIESIKRSDGSNVYIMFSLSK